MRFLPGQRRRRFCLATASRDPSGVGAHMLTLAHALAKDVDVTIAAPLGSPLLRAAARAGMGVKAIDPGGVLPPRRWFGRAGLDLVHVHAGIAWEGNRFATAARDAGIAGVLRTEHLPYVLTDEDQREDHAIGVAAVDRLICVSQAVAETHIDAGIDPAKITVIHNGVIAPAPARDRDSVRRELGVGDAPLLLMVGRFERQKGHAVLLDAMPAILARHPDAVLLLVGDGPLLGPVAQEVVVRGLTGSIRMTGRSDDVASLLAAADLFVLPSLFEGLPLAVLEAMAVGLPIVATNAPGTSEAIEPGRTGWLTPVGDPDALAETITAALADPAARARTAQAAREVFDAKYRAERMVAETRALYDTAIAAHAQGESMTRTRIAFIGAGGIAHRHFGVLDQFDDVEIAAVCDTDFARATDAAARFGARAFDDAEAMLDAVPVDAVYICVPPFAHGAPERVVLKRGLPFFVEKPVALDLETAQAIADEIAEAGIVTAVGYHWRYLDSLDEVRALLARTPARLLSGYWLDATPPPRWWWHQDQSGGQVVEQTTHLLDLARYLIGDVTQVYGLAGHDARAAFPDLDVPTVSSATLSFADGAIGNFASTCLLNWTHRVALHLYGEGFAVELTDHDVKIDIGQGPPPTQGNKSDPVEREDRDFIDAVQGKENRIRCPYAEAVETLRLSLAVGESVRTGQPVAFDAAVAKEPAHV